MVLLPVKGNGRLGGSQLPSQLGHLSVERGVGAVGYGDIGLHFNVPIATDMRIDNRGGAFGCPGPVGTTRYRPQSRSVAFQAPRPRSVAGP